MSLRRAISKWLAPEVYRVEERYWFLRQQLSEAQTWLGYDFPEIDEAIFWAKASEVNHFRALGAETVAAVPGKPWIWTISDFREHLRSKRPLPAGEVKP